MRKNVLFGAVLTAVVFFTGCDLLGNNEPVGLASNLAGSSDGAYISLSWSDANLSDGYQIERSTGTDGTWNILATEPSYSTYYTDNTVASGTLYHYRVRNIYKGKTSEPTAVLSLYSQLQPPKNVVAVSLDPYGVKVSWDADPAADRYEIFSNTYTSSFSPSELINYTLEGSTTENSLEISAPADYGNRVFFVKSYNATTDLVSKFSGIARVDIPAVNAPEVTLTPGPSSIKLTWAAVTGAAQYRLEWRIGGSSTSTKVDLGTATEYIFTPPALTTNPSATYPVVYGFRVFSLLSNGDYHQYPTEKTSSLVVLAKPVIQGSNINATTYKLSWQAVDGATSYTVERHTSSTYSSYSATVVGTPTDNWLEVDATGKEGKREYYFVTAKSNNNISLVSNVHTAYYLTTPSIATLTAQGIAAEITWTVNSPGVNVLIYRGETAGGTAGAQPVATVSSTTLAWTDTTVEFGKTYWYSLALADSGYTTSKSSESSIVLDGSINSVQATKGTELNQITLSWTALPASLTGVTYTVLSATSQNGAYTTIAGASGLNTTTYTHNGLVKAQSVYYKVQAYKDGNALGLAQIGVEGYTFGKAPTTPSASNGTSASPYIYISWSSVPGAKRYMVYVFEYVTDAPVGQVVNQSGSEYWTTTQIYFDPPVSYRSYYFKVVAVFTSTGTPTSAELSNLSPASLSAYAP